MDFRISKNRSFLAVANRNAGLIFINTTSFFHNTTQISIWDNEYKLTSEILNIEMTSDDSYIFSSVSKIGLVVVDIRDIYKPVKISEIKSLRVGKGL
jgi:hypothetical protein